MKQFLKKTFLWVMVFVLFLGILNFFVFPNNENIMSIKNNLLKSEKNFSEILILGNSHTFFGITPQILSYKAINIANKSRKLETDYYILKKNINFLKELKTVIVPISFYTLFANDLTEQEKRLYYNFFELKEYNQGWFKNSLLINEPFRELLNDIMFNNFKTILPNFGWRANSESYVFNEQIIKERVGEVDNRINNNEKIVFNLNILQNIIDLCDEKKVKLLIVLPPYHQDFYKYSKGKYQRKIMSCLNTLRLKSSKILDCKKLEIKAPKYFENVDHLNVKGAILLTKKIDSILRDIP